MKRLLPLLLLVSALPASATWMVTTEDVPSGCTHVITDGNWKIGVYRYSDDNWNLGKYSGANGSGYVAGSGDLDLTGVAADWKADARVLPFEGTEQATANAAAKALGLRGVKPIGKWTTGTNGTTHWVVEELPSETLMLIK